MVTYLLVLLKNKSLKSILIPYLFTFIGTLENLRSRKRRVDDGFVPRVFSSPNRIVFKRLRETKHYYGV